MERDGLERFPASERGVRTHEWLRVRRQTGPTHFYDLSEDAGELSNLAASPGHEAVLERLDAMLDEHMRRMGDHGTIKAFFPPPDFWAHERGRE